MKDNLTREEFERTADLVNRAIHAYNKADASKYISQLTIMKNGYLGYVGLVFSSLVSSVSRASGRVADKERLLYFVSQDLGKLEQMIKE